MSINAGEIQQSFKTKDENHWETPGGATALQCHPSESSRAAKMLDCGGSLPGRSTAATPLWDFGQHCNSGVALRSRRNPNEIQYFLCAFALKMS